MTVSALSLVGVFFLSFNIEKLKKVTIFLVSFSTGTLLGGALIHLLPESIEEYGSDISIWLSLLAGILSFFVLEKIIRWRHCHVPTSKDHPHPLGAMNLIGDGLHNFIDGIIIASAFLVDVKLGIATSIAVITHEIPQEIADFGILIHAGYTKKRALILNFLISLASAAGAILTILLLNNIENITKFIIPLTAGGFIYIATADLIPELRKEVSIKKSLLQIIVILLGIAIMYGLLYIG